MSARRLVLAFACALAIGGCASTAQKTPPPVPATAPQTPPPVTTTEEPQAPPPARGPATSPWDTAGTASGRAARRAHVYPQGPSPLGQKLVNAIPDPAIVKPGVQSKESGQAPVPPPPAPVQDPAPVASGSCWDVQILVTSDKGRAEQVRDRAERELNLSAWVKHDGMMHRVRVGGCLTAEGAAGLARRLHDEGYPEAFRVVREP